MRSFVDATRTLCLLGLWTTTTMTTMTTAFVPSSSSLLHRPASRLSSAVAVNGGTTAVSSDKSPSSDSTTTKNNKEDIRLNVYEKARTVTSVCTSGTLCTISSHEGVQGAPFGSFVDYVLDDQGNPVFLMNEMSMHTINIQAAAQAAAATPTQSSPGSMVTLFTQLGGSNAASSSSSSSQDVARCSLTGHLHKLDPATTPDMDTIRMRYSITHVYADQVMDSPKFAFYRLEPSKIYFVGGFGVLSTWVDPMDYQAAAPDILATEAAAICAKVNRDHVTDLRLTAQHLLGVAANKSPEAIEKVRMTNVDRLGMDLRVTAQQGTRRNKLQTDEFRIGFRIPVMTVEDAKSEILKIFQEAWEKANGYVWDDGSDELPGESVPISKIAADSLE